MKITFCKVKRLLKLVLTYSWKCHYYKIEKGLLLDTNWFYFKHYIFVFNRYIKVLRISRYFCPYLFSNGSTSIKSLTYTTFVILSCLHCVLLSMLLQYFVLFLWRADKNWSDWPCQNKTIFCYKKYVWTLLLLWLLCWK